MSQRRVLQVLGALGAFGGALLSGAVAVAADVASTSAPVAASAAGPTGPVTGAIGPAKAAQPKPAGTRPAGAASATATAATPAAGPNWASLTPAQQQLLAPLQRDWAQIEGNRKQKWLEMAARFPTMPADERQRVQQRMVAWANLSPAERATARLQFQEVRQLPAEERQERWRAYQALSDDERKALAQRARPAAKPASAAELAVTPRRGSGSGSSGINSALASNSGGSAAGSAASAAVSNPKRNMVQPPPSTTVRPVAPTMVQGKPGATTTTMSTRPQPPSHNQAGLPKIAATPGYVDPATLLPRRGPQGAAVRAGPAASDAAPTRP